MKKVFVRLEKCRLEIYRVPLQSDFLHEQSRSDYWHKRRVMFFLHFQIPPYNKTQCPFHPACRKFLFPVASRQRLFSATIQKQRKEQSHLFHRQFLKEKKN